MAQCFSEVRLVPTSGVVADISIVKFDAARGHRIRFVANSVRFMLIDEITSNFENSAAGKDDVDGIRHPNRRRVRSVRKNCHKDREGDSCGDRALEVTCSPELCRG